MRNVIAAINTTLDGFCDHTVISPDEEIHEHYTKLLGDAGTILYGRITYQLMEYWKPFLEKPPDEASMNDFARAIDRIQKVVFSHTLKDPDWHSAKLADQPIEDTLRELRQSQEDAGKDILVGSRSLILELMNRDLIDEYQICLHPVIAGKGLPLFDAIRDRAVLKLQKTKTFRSGAVLFYYKLDHFGQD